MVSNLYILKLYCGVLQPQTKQKIIQLPNITRIDTIRMFTHLLYLYRATQSLTPLLCNTLHALGLK